MERVELLWKERDKEDNDYNKHMYVIEEFLGIVQPETEEITEEGVNF
jgi:hypothetical protein